MKKILLILLLLSFNRLYAQIQPIDFKLRLEPTVTLPGIPVGLYATLTNVSSESVRLPEYVLLRVTPQTGEPFIAEYGHNSHVAPLAEGISEGESHVLPPGKTIELEFPLTYQLAEPFWFSDYRLSGPGIYQLKLILDPWPDSNLLSEEAIRPDESDKPKKTEPIVSNEVTVTVSLPYGEDLLVWNALLERTQNKGWGAWEWGTQGFSAAKLIWDQYPTSNYAPYVATIVPRPTREERVAIYNKVLSEHPDHPMAAYLHTALASYFEDLMWYELDVKRDVKAAKKYFIARQQQWAIVMNKTHGSKKKAVVQEQLKPTWDQIEKAHSAVEADSQNKSN